MADRNVREPELALAQRLGRLEERVRAMSLKAWSGAVRTEKSIEDDVDANEGYTTVVSVTATAGRWVVIAHSQVYIPDVTTRYDLLFEVSIHDPTSGLALDTEGSDLPIRRWWQNPYVGSVIVSPSVVGHFSTNDIVTVSLAIINLGGDAYTAYGSCLLLIPV